MGKTGTTILQREVFPKLCKSIKYTFLRCNSSQIKKHLLKLELNKKASPLKIPEKFFVSCEQLYGWDPYYWEEYAKKNQIAFGKKSHILITIREPISYLTSIYVQMLHQGNILKPKQFFLESEMYSERLNTPKFAIDQFSFKRLINIYLDKFNYVTIQKYETLKQLDFIKFLFQINEEELIDLKNKITSSFTNRLFSKKAVNLTFKLHNFLNLFEYSFNNSQFNTSLSKIKQARELEALNNISDLPFNKVRESKEYTKLREFRNHLLREFKWRYFIQNRFDRIFPYEKFKLDFKKLPYINIGELNLEYEKLPQFKTYKNENS